MDAPAARKQRAITSTRIDQTKPAYIVIQIRFEGLTRFCQLTGFSISTAHDWLTKGYIPPTRRDGSPCQAHILQVAADNGIVMQAADFVEQPANDHDSTTAAATSDA